MSSSEGFRVVDFVGAVPRRHRTRPSESLFPIQAHGAPEEQRPSTSSDASSLRRLLAHQHDALLAPVAPPRRSKGGNRYSLEAREQQVGNKAPLWDLVRGPISGGRRLLVELCIHIFEFLAYTDVVRVSRVSRLWHRASNADVLWARIHTSMRLVNDNDHDRLRFGIPAVSDTAASPSAEDPWRNAVGARGGSHKARVMRYVVATRQHFVVAADEASNAFRSTTQRLEERSRQTGTLTNLQHAELTLDVPRLRAVIAEAEATIAQQAAKAKEMEKQNTNVERLMRDAKATLAGLQSRLKATTSQVEQQATSSRRAANVAAFERRISSIVLEPVKQLPVALRRGVDSFGALDLLAAQLPGCTLLHDRWSHAKAQLGLAGHDYYIARDAYIGGKASSSANGGGVHLSRNEPRPSIDPLAAPRSGMPAAIASSVNAQSILARYAEVPAQELQALLQLPSL
jgi:hypothetical protein